jgi:hypothetical protein
MIDLRVDVKGINKVRALLNGMVKQLPYAAWSAVQACRDPG